MISLIDIGSIDLCVLCVFVVRSTPSLGEMYRVAKASGIKPILGIEGYMCEDRFDQRDKEDRTTPLDMVYNHIILLAKNKVGLENLNKLNEIAWTEGYYKKPRIDFEVLAKYKEGIIVSSVSSLILFCILFWFILFFGYWGSVTPVY